MKSKYYVFFLLFFLVVPFFSCASSSSAEKRKKETDVAIELAGMYHERQAFEEEKSTLKELIEEHGSDADPRAVYNLCLVYFEEGNYDEVIKMCEQKYAKHPAHLRFLRLMAKSCDKKGDKENAVRHYENLVNGLGTEEEDVLNLAAVYDSMGETERKKKMIESAVEKGVITKKILEEAVKTDEEREEYKILWRNKK